MNKKKHLACAVLTCASGLFGQAFAEDTQTLPLPPEAPAVQTLDTPTSQAPESQAVQAPEAPAAQAPEVVQALPESAKSGSIEIKSFPGTKYSLSPLPVDIYLLKGQKPTVTFTTPCIQIEKMTHGFPPIMAFENFMFTWISNVNDSELLPVRLEPVCI